MERDPPGDSWPGKRLCVGPATSTVKVVLESDMVSHIGQDGFYFDLVDFSKVKAFEVPGDTILDHLKGKLIRELGIKSPFQLRMFRTRKNKTCRPDMPLSSQDTVMPVFSLAVESDGYLKLYCEEINSDWPKDAHCGNHILVFLKFYDPAKKHLRYVGARYVNIHSNPCEIVPKLKQLAGIIQEKEILLYEEIQTKPYVICQQIGLDKTFKSYGFKDSDIICYQERPNMPEAYAYPYVSQFLQYMHTIKSLAGEMQILQQENLALKAQVGQFRFEMENKKAEHNQMNQILNLNSEFILCFLESTLNDATNYYAHQNLVEKNEYGHIYKGVIDGTDVAIKKSSNRKMFEHELAILRQCKQLSNVVKPLGRCSEVISYVYAWPSKGSLMGYIGGSSGSSALKWYDRTRIIGEICSVLLFLHSCQPPLVHGDLRPSNVLLDEGYKVMLTNIGMANEVLNVGSLPLVMAPYLDPEFLPTLELTPSSDVYSLGILMMCLLTGKPPRNIEVIVRNATESDSLHLLIDESATSWPLVKARQLTKLALRCAEKARSNRPNIMEISLEIEGLILKVEEKCTPAHFLCPINQTIMEDPHIAADGHTYDRRAIEAWFDAPHNIPRPFGLSPLTNANLPSRVLVPNRCLRSAIKDFQDKWRL